MNKTPWPLVGSTSLLLLIVTAPAQPFDIAPFGHRCAGTDEYKLPTTFDYAFASNAPPAFTKAGDRYVYSLQWAEERDIKEVQVRFASPCSAKGLTVQYWFQNWPYPPPAMPTIEDPVDDPWQGRWLTAKSVLKTNKLDCRFTFLPLDNEENPRAANLPGLGYRRTQKLRLVAEELPPPLTRIRVLTDSTQKTVAIRIELGVSGAGPFSWAGRLEAYNGWVQNMRGWKTTGSDHVDNSGFRITSGKGLLFDVAGTEPAPNGSHDVTIVTLRASVT
jgi:hypothetical protein